MSVLVPIWWLFFWTALGLCIGSFLNVVIYRLPRNQSIRDPLWSACPACGQRIRWYDNLPVVSFILLRARCRHCRAPISARYPIVEMLTALVVLALFDAFFIAHTREGLLNEPYLTWAILQDWPIFLAHLVLFACLLAMAAIDLTEYWLDIRFTTIATVSGFVLHTLWTPIHSSDWPRPHDATAVGALGALVGLGVLWLWLRKQAAAQLEAPSEVSRAEHLPDMPTDEQRTPWTPDEPADTVSVEAPADTHRTPLLGVAVVGILLVGTFILLAKAPAGGSGVQPVPWRALVPAVLVFALILAELRVPREADREIIQAIDAERHSARRTVLIELGLLLPAILLGAAGVWLQLSGGAAAGWLTDLLHWRASGSWQPVHGFTTAAAGYCIGGAMGWAIRIVFTLVFGREAFGLGDIHMMAAAGCVAGWPVMLLGFFVTVFLALLAWLLILPFKRTRAIPLVPSLALGYLVAVVHYEALLAWGPVRNAVELVNMLIVENSQGTAFGGPL